MYIKTFITTIAICSFLFSKAQEKIVIEGKVECNSTHTPLPYVNVYLKNNQIGIITNNNGEYILRIKKKYLPDTLMYSYIGYESEMLLIQPNADSLTLNIKLKPQPIQINNISVLAKKSNPHDILQNTYDYYAKQQHEKYKIDYYIREVIKNNNTYAYSAKGFLQAYTDKNFNFYKRNKLLNADLLYNDSLLFLTTDTPVVLDLPFPVLSYSFNNKSFKKMLNNDMLMIDTVMINTESKIYVLSVGNSKPYNIPLNYDMILNSKLADTLLKRNDINNESYKIYIENVENKYLVRKVEHFITGYSINNKPYFIKIEYYFKNLDNNRMIPTYKNYFMAVKENRTSTYYQYCEYVITKLEKTETIDKENYRSFYGIFPTYFENRKKFSENKNKYFNNYNIQEFNYIKDDSLEYLVKKDLNK